MQIRLCAVRDLINVSFLLKFFHKFSVDPVLDPEGRPAGEEQPLLVQYPLFVPQIEDQQIVSAGIKRKELLTLETGLEIMKKDGIFPDRVNPHLIQGPGLK